MSRLRTSKRFAGLIAILVLVTGITAACAQAQSRRHHELAGVTPAAYSEAVFQICANALLFEGSYALGTREGTVEAAADIRDSTRRRLARVAELSTPPAETQAIARWLAVEQRLADTYAISFVEFYDLIASLSTPEQSAGASSRARTILQASYPLRLAAGRLELQLRLPDCTGD
jgi:hypothetical protein